MLNFTRLISRSTVTSRHVGSCSRWCNLMTWSCDHDRSSIIALKQSSSASWKKEKAAMLFPESVVKTGDRLRRQFAIQSSAVGAVWKSRWPSWAPNAPDGLCGRKAALKLNLFPGAQELCESWGAHPGVPVPNSYSSWSLWTWSNIELEQLAQSGIELGQRQLMIVSENNQSQVGVREALQRKNAKSRESELPPYHPQLLRSWPSYYIYYNEQ